MKILMVGGWMDGCSQNRIKLIIPLIVFSIIITVVYLTANNCVQIIL